MHIYTIRGFIYRPPAMAPNTEKCYAVIESGCYFTSAGAYVMLQEEK